MGRNKSFLMLGGGSLALVVATVLVFGIFPNPVKISDDPPAPPTTTVVGDECTSQVHFYANDAPPGTNQFGPELVDHSVEAGTNRFNQKLCVDPAFAAAWEDVIVHNLANGTPEWYEARANQFIADRGEWQRAVLAIQNSISQMGVENRSENYHTLLMVPRGDAVPIIRRTDRPVAMGHVLVITLKDGRKEYARYVCDLQPARPEFPRVPSVKVPAPPAPPEAPRVPKVPPRPTTPPTVPPERPTTTVPPTTPPTTAPPCPSGKCTPPTTVAPPPTTAAPPPRPSTTLPHNDSGDGWYNTIPPRQVPTTVAPPAPPPPTIAPPTSRVEF